MALIFSKPFGFDLTFTHLLGMGLVILGLFLAALGSSKVKPNRTWLGYALLALLLQGIILSLFQWRCLLIQIGLPSHPFIPFSCPPEADLWFMPSLFLFAAIYQVLYFFCSEKRLPTKIETIGGSIGGIMNGLSTFFLLKATASASLNEKMMLFPPFHRGSHSALQFVW